MEAGSLSRRQLLSGAALAAAALGSAGPAAVHAAEEPADQIKINLVYQALVRRQFDGSPARMEQVRVRSISGRQVLVRCTAVQCCYSDVSTVLGGVLARRRALPGQRPNVAGHQGIGVVEAVGPAVRSVRTGDKVYINVTANCGWCYNCVRGRADACMANRIPSPVIGELMDGTPVTQDEGGGGIGGLSEYTVNYEERLTPVFTPVSPEEMSVMNCVGSTGLGMACTLNPILSGSNVVVFGAGPIGLSAIQGAKIQGATRIISVEPIAMRRQMALKLGATDALDPNQYGDKLVAQLRDMTRRGPIDRIFSGGRELSSSAFGFSADGPDYVFEAVGRQQRTPTVEQGPDPTGIQALEQVWDLVPPGGYGYTTGFGYHPDDVVKLNAGIFANGSKTMISSQNGGTQARRDLPRFTQLIADGKFDAKSLISHVYPFKDIAKAYQEVADRTVIANVITL
jgi:S-(hydroxymethyl)glutathione dehydrogenase/alcohol dehydrogenase